MLGKPKFDYEEKVKFKIRYDEKEYVLSGVIYVIDAYGTFYDNSDVSYDIMVEAGNPITGKESCLFKHIREDKVYAE